jgi:hypothetical protein
MPPEKKDGATPAGPRIAIRTMRTDAEELLKTAPPSLGQMVGRQPAPTLSGAPVSSRSGRKIPMLATAVIVLIIAALGGGGFLLVRATILSPSVPPKTTTASAPTRQTPPAPYFATETARTISVKKTDRAEFLRLMNDAWQEKERTGTVKRIIIKVQDGPNERFATPQDFFDLWRIAPPQELLDIMDPNLMVFMYAGETGNRLGFAVRTRDQARTFAAMLRWEPSLLAQITPMFFDERTDTIVAPFEDRTYRNIDWRYLKLSQAKDLGIGYGVFPASNVLIFTTGKEGAETTINRLFAQ